MVLKHDKFFTMVDPLDDVLVTVNVEYIEREGFQCIMIRSLEGVYGSHGAFMEENDYWDDPLRRSSVLPLALSGSQQLVDDLHRALQAAQES